MAAVNGRSFFLHGWLPVTGGLLLVLALVVGMSRCSGPDPVHAESEAETMDRLAVDLSEISAAVAAAEIKPCDLAAEVQRRIITTERPGMGNLEVEFWRAAITAAAAKHNVPAEIFTALVAQESHFKGHVTSNKGAKGAAQLMPVWTKDFDPFEIEPNLNKGAEVLAKYIKGAGGLRDGLRRYNGGPKADNISATAVYADAILARVYLAEKAACKPADATSV